MRLHRTLHQEARHLGWDRGLAPKLRAAPGDEAELELRDAGDGQLGPDATAADVARLDPARANPLTGPVRVEGAEPGDALEVEILDVETAGFGWTALIPGFGLLADEFPEPFLHRTRHDEARVAFAPGIELPTRPFPGTLGVAPAEPGRHDAIPPRAVGGNLDARDLVAGSRVLLPVAVPGALFSIGDAHAAQGRGEVAGTAIETGARVRVRFALRKGVGLVRPRIERPAADAGERPSGSWSTLGVGPDLREAARDAVRDMIDLLGREHRLAPELAYCLCSVAADLAIEEIVNAPNWVVSLRLSHAIFV